MGIFLYILPVTAEELPSEYAALKNPFNQTDKAVIERGGTLYQRNCSSCHGEKGDGQGYLSEGLPIKPFSKEFFSGMSDGYLLWVIENGKDLMPDFGPNSFTNLSKDDIWKIITFIQSQFGR